MSLQQPIADLIDNSWWEEKLKEAMNQIPEPCPDCGEQLEFQSMGFDPFNKYKREKDEDGREYEVLYRLHNYRCQHCLKRYAKKVECERVDVADRNMRQRLRSEWYEDNARAIALRSMFGKTTQPPARYRELPGYWDLRDDEKLTLGTELEKPEARAKVSGTVQLKEHLWEREGIYGDE